MKNIHFHTWLDLPENEGGVTVQAAHKRAGCACGIMFKPWIDIVLVAAAMSERDQDILRPVGVLKWHSHKILYEQDTCSFHIKVMDSGFGG
eukprot:1160985-Pelagomonas_calceolata.AAC.10